MSYKVNESRRHKTKKSRYKVTNLYDCHDGLRRRGDFKVWLTEDAIAGSRSAKAGARGRSQEYSDVAIETAKQIRQVFHLSLRQTEGLMTSFARHPKVDTAVPNMLDQVTKSFDMFIRDGAYDGYPVTEAVLGKQSDARVVIPPHKAAVIYVTNQTQRGNRIQTIAEPARIAWQQIMRYNICNYAELVMQRYKRIFGKTMRARPLLQQKAGGWVGESALNEMTNLGMPASVKI